MAKRKFTVEYTAIVEIKIEEDIINTALSDEWSHNFYNLQDAEGVASHLAFNLLQGRSLSSLDGFGDRKYSDVEYSLELDVERSTEKLEKGTTDDNTPV